jgi:Glycosyl hydrolases family 16
VGKSVIKHNMICTIIRDLKFLNSFACFSHSKFCTHHQTSRLELFAQNSPLVSFSTHSSMYCSHGDANRSNLLHLLIVISFMVCSHGNDFDQKFVASWGERNVRMQHEGVLALSLDKEIGSRIESKELYLYGKFNMEMKLARGESAGTITSFYVLFSSAL